MSAPNTRAWVAQRSSSSKHLCHRVSLIFCKLGRLDQILATTLVRELLFVTKGNLMTPSQCLSLILTACTIAIASGRVVAQEASVILEQSVQVREGSIPFLMAQAEEASPLTLEEATERLSSVPVFLVVSGDNAPVIANIEQEDDSPVQLVIFWLDQNAAKEALDNIVQTNPEVSDQARLIAISLSEALRVAKTEQENDGEITFSILPNSKTLEAATSMLNESGELEEPIESFPGIPVFYGESQEGVLTIEAADNEVVPFFFDREDLAATLERAGSGENAAVLDGTQIRVTSLDQVLNSMLDPSSDTNVSKIEFIPSRSALEYVQEEFPDTLQEPE